jgi:hypothetical protein
MNVGVVWLRAPKLGFEQLCRGLRADLGVDGLVVLVAKKPPTSLTAATRSSRSSSTSTPRGASGCRAPSRS